MPVRVCKVLVSCFVIWTRECGESVPSAMKMPIQILHSYVLNRMNIVSKSPIDGESFLFSWSVIRPTWATRTCDIASLVYGFATLHGKQIFSKMHFGHTELNDQVIEGCMIKRLNDVRVHAYTCAVARYVLTLKMWCEVRENVATRICVYTHGRLERGYMHLYACVGVNRYVRQMANAFDS